MKAPLTRIVNFIFFVGTTIMGIFFDSKSKTNANRESEWHNALIKSAQPLMVYFLARTRFVYVSFLFVCFLFVSNEVLIAQGVTITYPANAQNTPLCEPGSELAVRVQIINPSGVDDSVRVEIQFPTGIDYVAGSLQISGISPLTNFQEFDLSDLENPAFILTSSIPGEMINVGTFVDFNVTRSAGDCTFFEDPTPLKDSVIVTTSLGTEIEGDPNVNTYQAFAPSLSFTSITTLNFDLLSANTRTLTVQNGGLANTDSFSIQITYPTEVTPVSLSVGMTTLTPASIAGNVVTYTITSCIIPGGFLANNESMEFTEEVEINACSSFTSNATYEVSFGCGGQTCQTNSRIGTFTYDAGTFDIRLNQFINHLGTVCDSSRIRRVLYNVGAEPIPGVQSKLDFETGILVGASSPYSFDEYTVNGIPSVPTTTPVGGSILYSFDFSNTSVPGLSDTDGDGFMDDFEVGDSIIIEFSVFRDCVPACPSEFSTEDFSQRYTYTTLCDQIIGNTTRRNIDRNALAGLVRGFSRSPSNAQFAPPTVSDFFAGEVRVLHSRVYDNGFFRDCPDPSINFSLDLSTDFEIENDEIIVNGTVFSATRSGTTYSLNSASIPILPANGNVSLDITFNVRVSDTFCAGGGGTIMTGPIPYTIEFNCETLQGCCSETWACENIPSFVGFCGNSCSPTFLTSTVSAERRTFGFAPGTTNPVDTTTLPSSSLTKVINGDTIRLRDVVTIGDSAFVDWVHVITIDSIQGISPMALLEGLSFSYDGASGMSSCIIPVSDVIIDGNASGQARFRFDLSDLINNSCLPGMLDSLQAGADIVINYHFRMNELEVDGTEILEGLNQLVITVGNRGTTSSGTTETCVRQTILSYYAYEVLLDAFRVRNVTNSACATTNRYVAESFIFLTGGGLSQFPQELRTLVLLDSMNVRLASTDVFWNNDLLERRLYRSDGGPLTEIVPADNIISAQDHLYTCEDFTQCAPSDELGIPNSAPAGATRIYYFIKEFGLSCDQGSVSSSAEFDLSYRTSNTGSRKSLLDDRAFTASSDDLDPVFTGAGSEITAAGPAGLEQWVLRYNAPGSRSHGPFTYMYIDTVNSSGVSIKDVYRVSLGSGERIADAEAIVPYDQGFYAQLKDTLGQDRRYAIDFEYQDCGPDTVFAIFVKSCDSFPTDPANFACYRDTQMLVVSPVDAQIQLLLVDQPNANVDICDPLTYEIVLNSAQQGNVINPAVTLDLAPGLQLLTDTVIAEYPINSGTFDTIAVPVGMGSISIDLNQLTNLDSVLGLPGLIETDIIAERQIRVQFELLTNCDFTSGENFPIIPSGQTGCGAPAIGDQVSRSTAIIRVNNTPDNDYIIDEIRVDSIIDCGLQADVSYSFVIIGSDSTQAMDTFSFTLPPGISYVAGSYTCNVGVGFDPMLCPEFIRVDTVMGQQVAVFAEQVAVPSGADYEINFSVETINSEVSCSADQDLILNINRSVNMVPCPTEPSGFCEDITENKITDTANISVDLPILELEPLLTNLNAGVLSIEGSVANTGSRDLSPLNNIFIEFYCAGTDSIINSPILDSVVFSGGLAAGDSLDFNLMISDPCIVNNILTARVIKGNGTPGLENCVCASDSVFSQPIPSIECPPMETVVCSLDEEPIFMDVVSFVDSGAVVTGFCQPVNELTINLIDQQESSGICNRTIIRTYVVEDACGGADTCQQNILFTNASSPRFIESNDTIDVQCSSELPPFPDSTFVENCSSVTISSNVEITDSTSSESFNRLTTYILEDECGNMDTLTQLVRVNATTPPAFLNCPLDTITVGNDFSNCSGGVNWSIPIAEDICGNVTVAQYEGPAPGQILDGGVYDIGYEAVNQSGISDTCEFIVEVIDVQQPFIGCPQDITIGTDEGVCEWTSGAGSLSPIIAIENCEPSLTYEVTNPDGSVTADSGDVSGYVFTLGSSIVEYALADSSGLQSDTCSFMVTVEDEQAPEVICPGDTIVYASADSCGLAVVYDSLQISDNCELMTSSGAQTAITTLFASDNGQAGNMFDVENVGTAPIIIDSFYLNLYSGTISNIRVYYTSGTYIGNETNSAAWTLLGTESVISNGDDVPTLLNVGGLNINPGESFGIFIIDYPRTGGMNYTGGSNTYNNGNLEIRTGIGRSGIGGDPFTGNIFNPRTWNGTIHYTAAAGQSGELMQTDNSGLTSGSFFSVGTTLQEYTVTDGAGNSGSCSFSVTVLDTITPVIICPSDTIISVNAGECAGQLEWEHPNPFDNCRVERYHVRYINPNGSTDGPVDLDLQLDGFQDSTGNLNFELGTSIVEYYIEDPSGNFNLCSFQVTVIDDEAPIFINCPADTITVGNDFSNCSGGVNWSQPIATDNCEVSVAQTAGPTPGDILDVGNYTVTYIATDSAGNTAECTFTIEVIDVQDPIIGCPQDITIVTDEGVCEWTSISGSLSPSIIIENCEPSLTYEVTNPDGSVTADSGDVSGYVFTLGSSMVEYALADSSGLQSDTCIFMVTVIDDEAPEIVCPADEVLETDAGVCMAEVAFLTQPGFSDNCSAVADSIFYSVANPDNSFSGPFAGDVGYMFSAGISQVEWTILDSSGNSASCTQNITVEDTEAPTITCAQLAAAYDTDAGACDYTVQGTEFDPVVGDNCAVESVSNDYNATSSLANEVFPVGSTTVVWTVTDESGNTATCAITVVVEDNENPEFVNCPDTITVGNNFSNCSGDVNWSEPIAEDNCEVAVSQIDGPAPGGFLPVGNYTVTYIATDSAGNTAECTFTIEVLDVQDPIIGCPQDVTISTDAGVCEWASQAGSLAPSVAIENCGADLQWSVENPDGSVVSDSGDVSGYVFLLGESTVTYTLSDSTGAQVAECSFRVTVEDTEAPVVSCPVDEVVVNDAGQCSTDIAALTQPGFSDNCSAVADSVFYSVTNPDNSISGPFGGAMGYVFSVGVSQVEWTVVDSSGNSASCIQNITVEDTEEPTITCATLAAAYNTDAGACDYTVQGGAFDPVVGDNCAVESVSNDYNATSSLANAVFPVGSTPVVWTVTDESGNTATCAITVVVEDNENPVFVNCPADTITVGNDFSNCQGGVNWSVPIAEDNCEVSVAQTAGPTAGDILDVGNYTVTYIATDSAGNTAECTFTIEVIDVQDPIIGCPQDVTISTDA